MGPFIVVDCRSLARSLLLLSVTTPCGCPSDAHPLHHTQPINDNIHDQKAPTAADDAIISSRTYAAIPIVSILSLILILKVRSSRPCIEQDLLKWHSRWYQNAIFLVGRCRLRRSDRRLDAKLAYETAAVIWLRHFRFLASFSFLYCQWWTVK